MGMFADRVKSRIAAGLKPELLLLADRRVSHGDVIRLVNAAREAGIERVNVGEKPK
jgi:biopolymer transport protein ExbD